VPIPETTINEIRQHADIVSIIGQYVRLRQRGKNFIGLCPFHTEKTPSFNVSPSLGIYKCFGCGKSGDVFTFLREYAGMSFTEAVYHLARQLGISIPEDTPQVSDAAEHRRRLIACLEAACTFFRSQADHSPDAKKFFRERMLPESVIERFRLGYAPAEWTATSDTLQKQGFSRDLLIETGLSIRRDDGTTYDRFRHRIMFPITNHTGVVIVLVDGTSVQILINRNTSTRHKQYSMTKAQHCMHSIVHVMRSSGSNRHSSSKATWMHSLFMESVLSILLQPVGQR
jgi:DNA primase